MYIVDLGRNEVDLNIVDYIQEYIYSRLAQQRSKLFLDRNYLKTNLNIVKVC